MENAKPRVTNISNWDQQMIVIGKDNSGSWRNIQDSWKHFWAGENCPEARPNELWSSLQREQQIEDQDSNTISGLNEAEENEALFDISQRFTTENFQPEVDDTPVASASIVQSDMSDTAVDDKYEKPQETDFDFIRAIISLKSSDCMKKASRDDSSSKLENDWQFENGNHCRDGKCLKTVPTAQNNYSNTATICSTFTKDITIACDSEPEFPLKTIPFANVINSIDLAKEMGIAVFDKVANGDQVISESEEDPSLSSQTMICNKNIDLRPSSKLLASEVAYTATMDSGFNSEKIDSQIGFVEERERDRPRSTKSIMKQANDRLKNYHDDERLKTVRFQHRGNLDEAICFDKASRCRANIEKNTSVTSDFPSRDNHDQVRRIRTDVATTIDEQSDRLKRKKVLAEATLVHGKKAKLSISSSTFNYITRSSETDQRLLKHVKAILKVVKNAKISASFHRWHGFVYKEAITAVLNIIDQQAKNGRPDWCKREVIRTIQRVLVEIFNSDELDKTLIWEHHTFMLLELCNALSICKEIVNFLLSILQKLIDVMTETSQDNRIEYCETIEKSYIFLHSLDVVLRKYKVAIRAPDDIPEVNNPRRDVPDITESWKRLWKGDQKEPDIFVESSPSPEDQEETWTKILEKLVAVTSNNCPQIAIMSWQCLSVLKTSSNHPHCSKSTGID